MAEISIPIVKLRGNMNILVMDVAAETGGALTILHTYIEKFRAIPSNTYYVCVSCPGIESKGNIIVLNFPWVKKSWFHRLWFDYRTAIQLVNNYKIDEVFSLQNILVHVKKIPQDLYLHQSMPFAEKKFSIQENFIFWMYQNVISIFIYQSIKKARKITVQTKWMKEAVINRCKVNGEKVLVEPPPLPERSYGQYESSGEIYHFFYPAAPHLYKNHILIFQAVPYLVEKGITNFCITFTFDIKNLPAECKHLYEQYKDYFCLSGQLSYEDVLMKYSNCALLFPSYIESYGLPLLEAMYSGSPILASDCNFSHEILDNYRKAQFFNPSNAKILADFMQDFINQNHSSRVDNELKKNKLEILDI